MPRKAAAAAPTEGEETQARRSTRLAAQPKKDEPAAPKPAAKRAPAKKRAVDADEKEGEEKAPAAKKVIFQLFSLLPLQTSSKIPNRIQK